MERLDAFLSVNSQLQAIRKVDPKEYEHFRQAIREGMERGATQDEMDQIAGKLGYDYMQKRLKYATPATLRAYVKIRLRGFEKILSESPEAIYYLANGYTTTIPQLPEAMQVRITEISQVASNEAAQVILAPISDTPTRIDEKLVDRRLRRIGSRLTKAELIALRDENKPNVNKAQYGRARVHLYRELMKLPDVELAQVARSIGIVPKDDWRK